MMTDNNKSASAFAEVDCIDVYVYDAANRDDQNKKGILCRKAWIPDLTRRFIVDCPSCGNRSFDMTVEILDAVRHRESKRITIAYSCSSDPYCDSSFRFEIRLAYSDAPAS